MWLLSCEDKEKLIEIICTIYNDKRIICYQLKDLLTSGVYIYWVANVIDIGVVKMH